jgi:hypothetical protein
VFNATGEFKDDIKSIPDVGTLLTRDAQHLAAERRWIGVPTEFGRGVLNVVESPAPADPAVAAIGAPQA